MAGGRFFLGLLIGSAATAGGLLYLDHKTDLQTLAVARYFWPDTETPPPEDTFVPPAPEPVSDVTPPELSLEPTIPPPDSAAPVIDPSLQPIPLDPIEVPRAQPAPPQVTLVPETISPGIIFNDTGAEGLAPFTIITSAGADYYVKLVYEGTSTPAVGIFVQGGVSNEVLVPLGRYQMRYASGSTWYGMNDLFGPDTSYAKALDVLDFREEDNQYKGYTVELILQEGGNLSTEGINPGEF